MQAQCSEMSLRRSRRHPLRQTTRRRDCWMTLDDEDIERIAHRVGEVVASLHGHPAPQYVDAADLARMLGVDREWVYAHARRLGAIRLGGPGGRLRFDVRRVADTLAAEDPAARPARSAPSRRGARAGDGEVIQYEC
jgi:hypothetical protein